ncbi:TRAP transporter substrate-binding protein [Roseomonas sp. M0104]|uniref:TRAP transporter substrate-binding protein n=1 Tax=Teichococcus coralli TaxID=2545983 RepID=A0A845BGF0_9PROT|nr:TRAP transporter substrate-binding protein [Pseudoroseomonas coralli]MXP65160.1 TRAP transporter substrate-binding protein [Pseudoroseomonas coralli]
MTRRLMNWAAAAAIALLGWTSTPSQAQEWRGWNIHPPDYPVSKGMDRFTELVAQRSNGRLKLKTYHSAQLGQQDEAIQQMRLGSIDFAEFNLSPLNNLVASTQVLTLPYLFRDVEHLHRVVDGPVGDQIAAELEKVGIVPLAWYDAGARSFYTRNKVTKPEDLKGMKIRVQTSDLWIDLVKALGANPTPLPFGEVYTSLQSGVIDGAENNWPSYESTRHFEVAKYYITDEHSNVPEILAVSATRWRRLNDADKKLLKDAARESATHQRQLWAEREKVSRERVIAGGAVVTDLEDRSGWSALMKPVYDKYAADPKMADLVKQIRETK